MQALGRGGFLGWFARRPQPEGNAAEDEGAADEGMQGEWFVEDQPDQQRTQDRFQHGEEAFGSSEACIWSAIGHEPAIPRQAQGRQGPILALLGQRKKGRACPLSATPMNCPLGRCRIRH
jgi:hypothetical protein